MSEQRFELDCFSRAFVAVALALATAVGQASPISVNSELRVLRTSAQADTLDQDILNPSGNGLVSISSSSVAMSQAGSQLGSAKGTASQQAAVGGTQVSVSGSADTELALGLATGGGVIARANSSYQLEFSLGSASSYQLTGFVDTQAVATGGAGIPILTNRVTLIDLGTASTLFDTLTYDQAFSANGTLGPGSYRLLGFADIDANAAYDGSLTRSQTATSSYEFTFTVQPNAIPEPSSLLLVMAAAGWLGFRRRTARCSIPRGEWA